MTAPYPELSDETQVLEEELCDQQASTSTAAFFKPIDLSLDSEEELLHQWPLTYTAPALEEFYVPLDSEEKLWDQQASTSNAPALEDFDLSLDFEDEDLCDEWGFPLIPPDLQQLDSWKNLPVKTKKSFWKRISDFFQRLMKFNMSLS